MPYFLLDKSLEDRNDWYNGRKEMACSTFQSLCRSNIRQVFYNNLLTNWATGHEGLPPWLKSDEMYTEGFHAKAYAGRTIIRHLLDFLDSEITEFKRKSAANLDRVESKLTPSELLSSPNALKEHVDHVSGPIRQLLSEKREYLRHNQPSVSDLVTMWNCERTFPKKSNLPPSKKHPVSAAQGHPPTKRNRVSP